MQFRVIVRGLLVDVLQEDHDSVSSEMHRFECLLCPKFTVFTEFLLSKK